jgi:hypothetical protein
MLPAERQAQIIDWLNTRSIEETRKQLAADGFQTSAGALSEFRNWWEARQLWKQDKELTDQFKEWLEDYDPALSKEKVNEAGDLMFLKLAIKRQDNLEWVRIRREGTRDSMAATARRAINRKEIGNFIKWYSDTKVRETLAGDDSNDAKTEALGRHIFKEDWD